MIFDAPAARAASDHRQADAAEADHGDRVAGATAAVLRTAPKPVSTAQPSRAAVVERRGLRVRG